MRRDDPFAPRLDVLLIAAEAHPHRVDSLADLGAVTAIATLVSAREYVTQGRFTHSEDVVVVDGAPDDAPTLQTVQELRRRGCSVVLVSPRRDELAVTAAWHYGAHAYVVAAARASGAAAVELLGVELSARELAVLQAAADGATNAQIGQQLGISGLTVKSHLARIGHKLGTGDRAAMVARVMRAGLIH